MRTTRTFYSYCRENLWGNDSVIKEHRLFCSHLPGLDHFSILPSNNQGFKVTLMKSLLITGEYHSLNKNRHLLPSEVFDD